MSKRWHKLILRHVDPFGLSVKEVMEHCIAKGMNLGDATRSCDGVDLNSRKNGMGWPGAVSWVSRKDLNLTEASIIPRLAAYWACETSDPPMYKAANSELRDLFGVDSSVVSDGSIWIVGINGKDKHTVAMRTYTTTSSVTSTLAHAREVADGMMAVKELEPWLLRRQVGLCILADRPAKVRDIREAVCTATASTPALGDWLLVKCLWGVSPATCRDGLTWFRNQKRKKS